MAYRKPTKFRIYRAELNGNDVYCGEELTKQGAEETARETFSKRPNTKDQVFIQQEREILRICSTKIGFNKEVKK